MDIMMPKADGYTVGAAIRNNLRTRSIPILVVSGLQEMSQLFTATVQVEGFLAKPFEPEALIATVAKILDKTKARG
jgi:CheY-like chemotaxis protein